MHKKGAGQAAGLCVSVFLPRREVGRECVFNMPQIPGMRGGKQTRGHARHARGTVKVCELPSLILHDHRILKH